MIDVRGLGFQYASAERPVLEDVSFTCGAGELVLVAGPSGGGKSTLLRCLNGLVPHFHGGTFAGEVVTGGLDTRSHQPRDMAGVVGMVFQDPESQMVAETVEDEVAFGMELAGTEPLTMRKRVEEALDLLRIEPLRARRLESLSGGELQRVAIAAVLTMQPRVLLLDEPTSQLDPQAAEELLTTVQRLNDDLGLTVLIAEHRLERVVQYADRLLYVAGDGSVEEMDVREAMAMLPMAPPVSRLGRALGWSPLPLSVREGRPFATAWADAYAGDGGAPPDGRNGAAPHGSVMVRMAAVGVTFGDFAALRDVTLDLFSGEITVLMGRNGAGKTTLLRTLAGLTPPDTGAISVLGRDVRVTATESLADEVALVPQRPEDALYKQTVAEEIGETLRGTGREGSIDEALAEWRLEPLRDAHPADVSAGERQRVALAAMLAGRPRLLLLDEPTRGMDYDTKSLLVANLKRRCADGATVVLASHDVELAGRCADRVVLLAGGEVAVDGPAREVLSESLTFSTQVNKLMGGRYLTPEDVLASREGLGT